LVGLFRQELRGGKQICVGQRELASVCWLVPDYDDAVEVQFAGRVEETGTLGKCSTNIKGSFPVLAVPRDMAVCGLYGNTRVNLLRLWEAAAPVVGYEVFSAAVR
jgi:hypothetical protein